MADRSGDEPPRAPLNWTDDRLYDLAREITDEFFGEGTYAEMNENHPDPGVQRAIKRAND